MYTVEQFTPEQYAQEQSRPFARLRWLTQLRNDAWDAEYLGEYLQSKECRERAYADTLERIEYMQSQDFLNDLEEAQEDDTEDEFLAENDLEFTMARMRELERVQAYIDTFGNASEMCHGYLAGWVTGTEYREYWTEVQVGDYIWNTAAS